MNFLDIAPGPERIFDRIGFGPVEVVIAAVAVVVAIVVIVRVIRKKKDKGKK